MSGWDEEEDEESSFISMTDMMVGLLLIFIILTTYFALQARNVIEAADKVSKVEQAAVVARGILFNRIQQELEDERVQFDAATGTIRFSDDVLRFSTGSDEIPPASFDILGRLADAMASSVPCLAHVDEIGWRNSEPPDCSWLAETFESDTERATMVSNFGRHLGELTDFRPELGGDEDPSIWIDAVHIEGHTDCEPFGRREPDFGNWQLGASRASRTLLYLLNHNELLGHVFSKNPDDRSQAIGAQRVFGVASYADRRPAHSIGSDVYPEDPRRYADWREQCALQDDAQLELNRRIDIRIVMGWTASVD